MSRLWGTVKRMFKSGEDRPPDLEATLSDLRTKTPAPVFWLIGKTQSGKTSIIKFLTGADEKYMLSLRGICGPHMSGYYRPLNEAEQEQVRRALEACGYMQFIRGEKVKAAE